MDSYDLAQDIVRCDMCDTPDTPYYCDNCFINLCAPCAGEHLFDKSKEHKVVPFKQRRSIFRTPKYPNCPKHTQKQCRLFCELCDVPICLYCVSSDEHSAHKRLDIFDSLKRKKEVVKRDLQEMETFFYPKYQEIASNITIHKDNLIQNLQKLTRVPIEHGEELHTGVKKLNSKVVEIESKELAVLNKQEDEIKHSISDITETIIDLKNLLDSNDVSLLLVYRSRNAEFRRFPPKLIFFLPTFSCMTFKSEKLSDLFGSLTMERYVRPFLDEPRVIESIKTLPSVQCDLFE